MNHFAHSEVTKMAKSVEATLKGKLDDMDLTVTKLEAELKQYVPHPIVSSQNLIFPLDRYIPLISLVFFFPDVNSHSKPIIPKKYKNVNLCAQRLVA